jgi:hypothetical protein
MRARGSLRSHTPCSIQGGAGEGPGRENSRASLSASLTNSLNHLHQIGVTRPDVPIPAS